MSAATATATAPGVGMAISHAELEAHRVDMARRQKEHDAKAENLMRCTDPAFAASCEMQKAHYRFEVSCEWWTPASSAQKTKKHHPMELDNDDEFAGGRMERRSEKRTVLAQDEQNAWAVFCDVIECWPSPNAPGLIRKFNRGKQPIDSQKLFQTLQVQNAPLAARN